MKLPYWHLKFLRPTEAEAATCCQIVEGTSGIVARLINKRFSLPISLWLSRKWVKPNHITYFNILVGLLSGLFAWQGTPFSILIAGFLFQLASVLDGVDGEVAKLNKSGSQWGQWLDTISDNLTLFVFLAGLTSGLYRQTGNLLLLWAGEIALAGFLIVVGVMLIFLKRNSSSGSFVTYDKEFVGKIVEQKKGFLPTFVRFGRYLMKKDSFAMAFFLLTLTGYPAAILYLTAIGTTTGWMLMAYYNLWQKIEVPLKAVPENETES